MPTHHRHASPPLPARPQPTIKDVIGAEKEKEFMASLETMGACLLAGLGWVGAAVRVGRWAEPATPGCCPQTDQLRLRVGSCAATGQASAC